MLTNHQFRVLEYLTEHTCTSQREIAENVGLSTGTVNSVFKILRKSGFVDGCSITSEGYNAMTPYRVDNAIILAAGMATRFVPFSYEIPKALIKVKGEPMIERMIQQLRDTGIHEIIVVIGYMMEKFLYLRDKYDVKFVVNNEFAYKNTHSSIYVARDFLKNTLILCADNYYPHNKFNKYEYRSYYCAVYLPGISYTERSLVTDAKGLVIDTHKPSCDEWIMYGHAYWDKEFSSKFKRILENYYGRMGTDDMYWETIWAENLKECPLHIKKCSSEEILEFDNVSELEAYDSDYILNNSTSIMENICSILYCEPRDVRNFQAINTGLNNRSFVFTCKGRKYVYRHPGRNAEGYIDREKEAYAQRCARDLGIDTSLIYIDKDRGWKISKWIGTTQKFDFSDKKLVGILAHHLRKLHEANIVTGSQFSYLEEADKLAEIIKREDYDAYFRIEEWRRNIIPVYKSISSDGWQISLCHNDIYEPNLLVQDDEINLIDWEFSGDSDIGYDICKIFCVLNPEIDEIDEYLKLYYGRSTTENEKRHLIGCAAIVYYYWYVWAIYVSKNGTAVSNYMLAWYDKMVGFLKIYSEMEDV